MPTLKRQSRRPARNKLRSLLPESARDVVWEGKKFIALPDQELDAWLEDLVDGIEATLAMRETGSRVSQADIKKRYGLD